MLQSIIILIRLKYSVNSDFIEDGCKYSIHSIIASSHIKREAPIGSFFYACAHNRIYHLVKMSKFATHTAKAVGFLGR
jgi:hypothetical protein